MSLIFKMILDYFRYIKSKGKEGGQNEEAEDRSEIQALGR